ncbi:MAG: glycosyltransferase, partial [Bacteroidota bacterium]
QMVLSRRQWLIHLCVCTWALLTWGLMMPQALALGGLQPPRGEMAPTCTWPTKSGAGEISLADYRGRWVVLYLAWFHSLNEQMQPTRLKIHIKRLFLKLADCVIANSTLTAVQLYEIYGVKKKKIETLPFWSNIDNQISEPQSKTLFLDKKNIVLGCPGRMVAHKNQKIVIKALSNLKKKGITNFELNFAGNGEDLSKLVDLAKNLEVASEINFLGHLSPNAMSKFYKTCDIIILPSLHEAFGLVFIEAVALNVPVLVSSSFGALSFIDPSAFDISKFSFNPESSKDLTEKLLAFKKHRFKPNFFRDLYLKTFDKREIFVKVMKAINQSKI